jgi:hypothetical protein
MGVAISCSVPKIADFFQNSTRVWSYPQNRNMERITGHLFVKKEKCSR